MEQKFSNNSLDLETAVGVLQVGGLFNILPYFLPFCKILYLVERMASWVMPMMRRTALSSISIS